MSDPLGLNADQRAHEEFNRLVDEFLAWVHASQEYINSLPDGSTVTCDLPWCEIKHPVEMFR